MEFCVNRILHKQKPLKWRTKCIPMYKEHIRYPLKNFSSVIFFPHLYQFKNLVRKNWGQLPKFLDKNKINSEGMIHITARFLNLSPDFRYRKMVFWLSSLIPHLGILCTNNILLVEMAYHLTIWFKTCLCNFIYRHFFMVGF